MHRPGEHPSPREDTCGQRLPSPCAASAVPDGCHHMRTCAQSRRVSVSPRKTFFLPVISTQREEKRGRYYTNHRELPKAQYMSADSDEE